MSSFTSGTAGHPAPRCVVSTDRVLRISVDQAWEAWTTPSGIEAWWSAVHDATATVDFRTGGRLAIRTRVGGLSADATLLTADPPRRLLLSWRWLDVPMADEPPADELVAVDLGVTDDEVVVSVEHETTFAERDLCAARWNELLHRLAPQSLPHRTFRATSSRINAQRTGRPDLACTFLG